MVGERGGDERVKCDEGGVCFSGKMPNLKLFP